MAIIYPRVRPAPSEKVSQAELDVLDELEQLPADWIGLHSLWLKTHAVKLHAEADFILITGSAVLIVEVKGGEVWRDSDHMWHFRRRDGSGHNEKREGPLDQASGAYYALRDHFSRIGQEGLFGHYVWGYCAIVPDCTLRIDDRDAAIDPELVLDNTGFPAQFRSFLDALTAYWSARQGGATHHKHRKGPGPRTTIPPDVRRQIAECLRPEMERVIGVGASVASSEQQLIRLTRQQLAALDFASAEPRNILIGSAGTGKTVLAVEQARRMAASGHKVLFVCFNSLLAARVREDLRSKGCPGILVLNYHQLAIGLAKAAGAALNFGESWSEFQASLKESLVTIVAGLDDSQRYDYLVIDEAQDLMSADFIELLDCLVKGGLADGCWLMAVDTQQAIFRSQFDQTIYDRLQTKARKTLLDLNCRNTLPIAAHVRALSGVGSVSTRGAEGEWPVVRYYGDRAEYLRVLKRVVNELVDSFQQAKQFASDIVLLTANLSFLPDEVLRPGFFLRTLRRVDQAEGEGDFLRYATIQQFKGLEAKAVVILGIEDFDHESCRELFYVGASRGRSSLRILLPKSCEQYLRAGPEILRLTTSTAEPEPVADVG